MDLKEASKTLGKRFKVRKTEYTVDEMSLYKEDKTELVVEADTLTALLSRFRAVLNQKESKPFTAKDLELREEIGKLYPHERPTPFPWQFVPEPKYEVEK